MLDIYVSELQHVFSVIEKVLVYFLAAKKPNITVVGDGAFGQRNFI